MITLVKKTEPIITRDASGRKNGILVELAKDENKTIAYLISIDVNSFKGYHYHKVRHSHYTLLRGKLMVILYKNRIREEYLLEPFDKIDIPPKIATGLKNIGRDEVWLVNHTVPPYDPEVKDEQLEFSEEELEQGTY